MALRSILSPCRRHRREIRTVFSRFFCGPESRPQLPAGLDAPPPKEIVVEYSEGDDDFTDYFIELANSIEDVYPDIVVYGNPEGVAPRDTAFEVRMGEVVLFSRFQTGRLPSAHEILKSLRDHLGEDV